MNRRDAGARRGRQQRRAVGEADDRARRAPTQRRRASRNGSRRSSPYPPRAITIAPRVGIGERRGQLREPPLVGPGQKAVAREHARRRGGRRSAPRSTPGPPRTPRAAPGPTARRREPESPGREARRPDHPAAAAATAFAVVMGVRIGGVTGDSECAGWAVGDAARLGSRRRSAATGNGAAGCCLRRRGGGRGRLRLGGAAARRLGAGAARPGRGRRAPRLRRGRRRSAAATKRTRMPAAAASADSTTSVTRAMLLPVVDLERDWRADRQRLAEHDERAGVGRDRGPAATARPSHPRIEPLWRRPRPQFNTLARHRTLDFQAVVNFPDVLRCGRNCWRIATGAAGRLPDRRRRLFRRVPSRGQPRARDSIFILGWDIDSRVQLDPGNRGAAARRCCRS